MLASLHSQRSGCGAWSTWTCPEPQRKYRSSETRKARSCDYGNIVLMVATKATSSSTCFPLKLLMVCLLGCHFNDLTLILEYFST